MNVSLPLPFFEFGGGFQTIIIVISNNKTSFRVSSGLQFLVMLPLHFVFFRALHSSPFSNCVSFGSQRPAPPAARFVWRRLIGTVACGAPLLPSLYTSHIACNTGCIEQRRQQQNFFEERKLGVAVPHWILRHASSSSAVLVRQKKKRQLRGSSRDRYQPRCTHNSQRRMFAKVQSC